MEEEVTHENRYLERKKGEKTGGKSDREREREKSKMLSWNHRPYAYISHNLTTSP